jgi:ABC-type polysaccharide/polyol phosphate export permease
MFAQSRTNFRIFCALLRRDLYILSKHIAPLLIDGVILVISVVLLYGYLFPLAGMPSILIGPLFIGTSLGYFFQINYSQALRVVFDLKTNRIIDYHLTLPISKVWLYAEYILTFALYTLSITAPLLFGGLFLLRNKYVITECHPFAFLATYLLTLLFCATLFLTVSYRYPEQWFIANIWPRRLAPIYILSAVFFPWKMLYAFWPAVGILFLFNPFTYAAEGMRSAYFGSDLFIPYYWCGAALMGFTALAIIFLHVCIKKRVNPV